jgi:DNA-binding MarR family transcriptional regulator
VKPVNVDLRDPILSVYVLFVQTADAVLKFVDAYFYKKTGLSTIKFIVLQVLAANGGTMTPSQIAQWTLRERNNITTLVERMEQGGLVRTERDVRDRRFVNVALTEKGRKVLAQAIPVARDIVEQVMSSITEADTIVLKKSLASLRENATRGLEGIDKHPET